VRTLVTITLRPLGGLTVKNARAYPYGLMNSEPYRFLDVRVRPCPLTATQLRWQVLEDDGQLVEMAARSYATEAEARRAGNAAARHIRKTGAH